jgi:hypothetical protein
MNYFFSVLLLLLLTAQLSAQAPGYLGNQLYIKSEGGFSLSKGPTANNRGSRHYYGQTGGGFGLDTRFGLQAGYAYSRMNALTFGLGYQKTGMECEAYSPVVNAVDEYDSYDQHELFYNLKGVSSAVGYQWFRADKGAIAPYGAFGIISLQATFLKGEILDKMTYYNNGNLEHVHAKLGTNPRYTYMSFGLEFGNHSVIKDKLLLSYSLKFNLPLDVFRLAKILDPPYLEDYEGDYQAYNQEVFRQASFERMYRNGFFEFKLGFGLFAH